MSAEQSAGTGTPDASSAAAASSPFAQWSAMDQRQAPRPFAHAFRQPQATQQHAGMYASQSAFNAGSTLFGQNTQQQQRQFKPYSFVEDGQQQQQQLPTFQGLAPPHAATFVNTQNTAQYMTHPYPATNGGVQIQQSQMEWIGMDPAENHRGQYSSHTNGHATPLVDSAGRLLLNGHQARQHEFVADVNAQPGPSSGGASGVPFGTFDPSPTAPADPSRHDRWSSNGYAQTPSQSSYPHQAYTNGVDTASATPVSPQTLPPQAVLLSTADKGKARADSETTEVQMEDGTITGRPSPAVTTHEVDSPEKELSPPPRKPASEYTDEELITEARGMIIDDLLKYFRKDILSRAVLPRILHHMAVHEGGSAMHAAIRREDERERRRQAKREAAGADWNPDVLDIDLDGLADSDDDIHEKARRVRRERERRGKRAKANPKRPRTTDGRFLVDDDIIPPLPGMRKQKIPIIPSAATTKKPQKPKTVDAAALARSQARKLKELNDLGAIEDLGPRRRTQISFGSPEPGDVYHGSASTTNPQSLYHPPRTVVKPTVPRPAQPKPAPKLKPQQQAEPVFVDTFYAQDAGVGMTFGRAPAVKLEFGSLDGTAPFPSAFDIRGVDWTCFRDLRAPDFQEVEFRQRWREEKRNKLWERAQALTVPGEEVKPVEMGLVFAYERAEAARDWDLECERARVGYQARYDALCSIPTMTTTSPILDPLAHGVADDVEDLYFVQRALDRLRQGQSMHLVAPEDDPETVISRHSSGSARTEGFYKMTVQEKMANRPPPERPVVQAESDWVKPPDKSGVAVSRAARVNNRGAVRGMEMSKKVTTAIDSDVINFNQLKTRKKQLTFARSGIEGYGLFAKEHIPQGDMVIEYVGELIRQQVADRREKAYERQGIGSSYLFRVDEDLVVDATKKGNLGRLINHCCVPNCTARIITINNSKKIVIYAKRNIEPGEEVTYDYHFAHEDVKVQSAL
ncbi:hypothetical protein ACM66B_005770 [Microbotryomycetes sp. NB124-2]